MWQTVRMRVASLSAALLLAGVLGTVGYLIGHNHAPTREDAAAARRRAFRTQYLRARQTAEVHGHTRGARRGLTAGKERGRSSGTDLGKSAGAADSQEQLAAAAAAQVEAQRQAAIAATQERAANCGAPLFVSGYCPTDAEVQQENQAEALCGSGLPQDSAEAARLGIDC